MLVDENTVNYDCNGAAFTYSASQIAPYKQLTVSMTIKFTGFCSATNNIVLLSVSIVPPSGGSPKNIMKATYKQDLNVIRFSTENASGDGDVWVTPANLMKDKPLTIMMSADLTSGVWCSVNIDNEFWTPAKYTGIVYDPDWIFGSSTRVSVCSNYDGIPKADCLVQYLKVISTPFNDYFKIPFSNKVAILADYKLNENDGNTLIDAQGSPNPAFLSAISPPVWAKDFGLGFDGSSGQWIHIPIFIPSGQDMSITTSVGFGFYIKIDQIPTSVSGIMYYWCNSVPANVFALEITPEMKLRTTIINQHGDHDTALTLGKWAAIYVVYSFTAGGYGISKAFIDGADAGSVVQTNNGLLSASFSTADAIKIGGFIGRVKRIQIYSPAAVGMNTGANLCNPSSCSVEMGFNDPQTCMFAVCSTPGTYPSFGTCEPCPTWCATCTNLGECQTCKSASYPINGACIPCPTNCTSCTDSLHCQSCDPGYGIYQDLCVICPTRTYLDSNQICQNCPMHCATCTDAQTCQTCDPNYGLLNNLCMICPVGTYLQTDQTCKTLSAALQETLTNSQLVNSAATQIANAISKGSSVSLSAMVGGKIFSQIKYLNISYSGELQVALLTWLPSFISLGLTPDMPESIQEKIPERHVPYVFEKYEVSSSFLVNFWENLGVVLFVSVLWLIFKGIELMMSSDQNSKIALFFKKGRIMIQNFLIAVLLGVYGDLVLFGIIEYRTFSFGWNLSLFSFIISVILLITMFLCFFFQTQMLKKYQRTKKRSQSQLELFMKAHEGSQVFFKDFQDDSLSQQLFPFFLSGRDIIFSFILATMFEYPLAQTLIFTLLDVLMIAYLFIKRPFESTFDLIQQLFFEFVGLVVSVSVFINAIFDAGKYQTLQGRNSVGKLLIVANMMFNFVAAVFMLIVIAQAVIGFYKERKNKITRKFKAPNLQNRLQNTLPIDISQASLRKGKTLISEQILLQASVTSQNNLETISFQQESFDLGHSNSIPNMKRNPRRNKLLTPSQLEVQETLQTKESQNAPRIRSRKNPSRLLKSQKPSQGVRLPGNILPPKPLSDMPQNTRPRR